MCLLWMDHLIYIYMYLNWIYISSIRCISFEDPSISRRSWDDMKAYPVVYEFMRQHIIVSRDWVSHHKVYLFVGRITVKSAYCRIVSLFCRVPILGSSNFKNVVGMLRRQTNDVKRRKHVCVNRKPFVFFANTLCSQDHHSTACAARTGWADCCRHPRMYTSIEVLIWFNHHRKGAGFLTFVCRGRKEWSDSDWVLFPHLVVGVETWLFFSHGCSMFSPLGPPE